MREQHAILEFTKENYTLQAVSALGTLVERICNTESLVGGSLVGGSLPLGSLPLPDLDDTKASALGGIDPALVAALSRQVSDT